MEAAVPEQGIVVAAAMVAWKPSYTPLETRFEGIAPAVWKVPRMVALLPHRNALQLMLPEHVRFDVFVLPETVRPSEHVNAFENEADVSPTARVQCHGSALPI